MCAENATRTPQRAELRKICIANKPSFVLRTLTKSGKEYLTGISDSVSVRESYENVPNFKQSSSDGQSIVQHLPAVRSGLLPKSRHKSKVLPAGKRWNYNRCHLVYNYNTTCAAGVAVHGRRSSVGYAGYSGHPFARAQASTSSLVACCASVSQFQGQP